MFAKTIVALLVAVAATAAHSASNAETEKAQQRAEIAELVASKNYPEVSRRAASELTTQRRFADGLWRLSFLYQSFWSAMQSEIWDSKDWDTVLKSLELSARKNPMDWFLYVETLSARAWSIRGPGFASTVSPEAMNGFRKYQAQARAVLDKHKAELSANPAWFSLRASFALELGEGEDVANRLFEEGRTRHPNYHAIYFARMRYATPIWGGSKEKMLAVLDKVKGVEGAAAQEGIYARLVWLVEDSGYSVVHSDRIAAQELRNGFDAIAESYPDQWNIQRLFFMACERSEKQSAIKLLAAVQEPPLQNLWRSNAHLYATCKDWAEGRIQAFIMNDHEGDQVVEYLIK